MYGGSERARLFYARRFNPCPRCLRSSRFQRPSPQPPAPSDQKKHSSHHARYAARRPDGISRADPRADAVARRVRADGCRVHARLRSGADHDRLARDDPDGYLPAVSSRERLRIAVARNGALSPCAAVRRRLSDGRVRRIADSRPAQRHRPRLRSRLRRVRRRLSAAPPRSRSASDYRPAGGGPWFLWLHVYDPHDPYDPPSDLKKRFTAAPYDGEIAAVDRAAGHLIAAAGATTFVAVAADHGEALGDHGEDTHGMFLYEAELHVPLIVRVPGLSTPGSRISSRVRLADLAPTLVEAAGVAVPPAMQGESLVRLKPDATDADRPAYAETEYPRRAFGWSPLTAWRADRFLYVRAPKPELYDLIADPNAGRNLAAGRPRIVDGMQRELDEFIRKSGGAARATGRESTIDPDLARRLAALGYVSGSTPPASGVDAKDRIALANALHAAQMEVDDGAFERAIPLLEKVTASEPNVKLAQLQLGVSRAHQKQYARAVQPLKKATALDPEDMFAHYELGVALYETGDLKTAAGHFEIVASRMPKWADARYSLGSVYARIDRVPDAGRELRAALDLEPRHFRANLLLGRILTLQGDPQRALPYLQTAADVQPSNAEARQFLADAVSRGKK